MVYDISDNESFKNLTNWMKEVDSHSSSNVIKLLIGNKNDLENKRAVSYEDGLNFAKHYGMSFMEVSAKTGTNITECFSLAAKEIKNKEPKKIEKVEEKVSIEKSQQYKPVQDRILGCCK